MIRAVVWKLGSPCSIIVTPVAIQEECYFAKYRAVVAEFHYPPVGMVSSGRFSSISVRLGHVRLWDFICFPSSGWVVIHPSLCSSQGACARNSANSPQPFNATGRVRFLAIMVIFPALSCAHGTWPCLVSHLCPHAMSFSYLTPMGWCHATKKDVRMG